MNDERSSGSGSNERMEARRNELQPPGSTVTPESPETEADPAMHASPEWREFYRAVRSAVRNMRSDSKDDGNR